MATLTKDQYLSLMRSMFEESAYTE